MTNLDGLAGLAAREAMTGPTPTPGALYCPAVVPTSEPITLDERHVFGDGAPAVIYSPDPGVWWWRCQLDHDPHAFSVYTGCDEYTQADAVAAVEYHQRNYHGCHHCSGTGVVRYLASWNLTVFKAVQCDPCCGTGVLLPDR